MTDPVQAVVLAGGKGTRLRPYTEDTPKALVKIGDDPVIAYLFRRLHLGGVRTVHMAVGHLAAQVEEALGDGSRFGLELHYSVEPRPLSTVGPLKLIDNLPEHFIVANADILSDLDIGALYRNHLETGADVTVAALERFEPVDFGVLELSADGAVTGFYEKPTRRHTVSMGIYVFSREVLSKVPDGVPFGFDDLMIKLVGSRGRLRAFLHEGYWLDIGRPDDYETANRDIQEVRSLLE
jgi:NDP-sugar pyrophosphorylase family protein